MRLTALSTTVKVKKWKFRLRTYTSNVTAASRYERIPGFIALNAKSVFFGIAVAVVCLISFLITLRPNLLQNAIRE